MNYDLIDKTPLMSRLVIKQLYSAKHKAYFVGGCVRDLLLGLEPHDWDICTSATPQQVKEIFSDIVNASVVETGIKYGTVTVHICGESYEVTTFRVDGDYSDGRKPDSVAFTDDITKDLSRRDFTINAMAYDIYTGEIIDPFGGQKDLQQGIIRCVGSSEERVSEDALRMLRAIRFAIKYNFTPVAELEHTIHNHVEDIKNVSKERITDEFRKIFATGQPIKQQFSDYSDLIAAIIPEIKPCIGFNQNNKYHIHDVYTHMLHVTDLCSSAEFEIKMAALLHDIGKPDCYTVDEAGQGHFYKHPIKSKEICTTALLNNFRLSSKEYDWILELIEYHDMYIAETKKSCRKAISKFSLSFLKDYFILKQADIDDHIYTEKKPEWSSLSNVITIVNNLINEESCFSLKDLAINGDDLIEIGFTPSKLIGKALNYLLDKVLMEYLPNDKETLLAEAKYFLVKERFDESTRRI